MLTEHYAAGKLILYKGIGVIYVSNIFNRKELIYTVYKEKSFSKAAQKLFIAQPSLSAMVKKTEEEIGLPLFDRTSKPIRLTEAGKEYIAAVEQIRQIENNFENYLMAVNNLEAGTLGIGSNQLLSSLVLPRYISSFMQTYPSIKLSLMDANSTTLENQIMAGNLDIVIDNHKLPNDQFEHHVLAQEHLFLAVPAGFVENNYAKTYRLTYEDILAGRHIGATLSPVPLELFSSVPFILMNRNNDARRHTDAIFHKVGFRPKVLLEMDRLTILYSYIEMGTAASVVSDTLIRNVRSTDSPNIFFYPLPTEHAKRAIYASYKRNKFCSKAMKTFIDSLKNLQ